MRELLGFVLGLLLGIAIISNLAHAHEDAEWILQDKRKLGHAWCCGPNDCGVLEPTSSVEPVEGGYVVEGRFMSDKDIRGPDGNTTEWRRVYPSEDFQMWICRGHDGKPKCFFPAESF
jgi:hypothetical protein